MGQVCHCVPARRVAPNAFNVPRSTRSRSYRLPAIMDESREEMMQRISIDSLKDWHRMKSNFTYAVFDQFDQGIRQNKLESERATLLPYLQQAHGVVAPNRFHG